MAAKKKTKPKGLPVERSQLAQYYSTHPKYVKGHPHQVKANPKTYKTALALVAKRKKAAGEDPDLFTRPMGLTQATQTADTLAGAQYDPAIRASKELQDKQLPAWYQDYTTKLHDIQNRQGALNATTAGQIGNFANTSTAVDQAQRDQMGQQMAGDAAKRGAQVDPNLAALAQQASAARRAGTDQFGALQATLGGNQSSFLLDKERISGGDLIARRAEQGKVQQGLLTQRGAEKAKQLQTIRENERRSILENKAFGLNVAKAQSSADAAAAAAAAAAAKAKEAARHNRATERNTARANAIADWKAHHPKQSGGKNPSNDQAKFNAKFNKKFNNDFNRSWTLLGAYPKKYVRTHRAQIMAVLVGKQGLSSAAATAAYNAYVK